MPEQLSRSSNDLSKRVQAIATSKHRYRRIVACVDSSHFSRKAISHAITVAKALGAELILMRVIEAKPNYGVPSDPVEWDLRRQEACAQVEKLAKERADEVQGIQTQVLEGRAADQICIWAQAHQVDLMVLCSHGEGNATKWDLGNTARRIVERARGSVLLVPAHVEESPIVRYRRLLVPLDGSSRAESAILIAVRLAEAQKAELLLVHVVPEPELTEIGPLEPEDIELRKRLVRRNQRVAQEYLDRIRARLVDKGVPIRTLILQGGDVRHTLARAIVDEAADLAVVASHGRSGHIDTAAGNVTAYLIGHTPIPLLVVRSYTTASMGHAGAGRNYARFRLSSQTLS